MFQEIGEAAMSRLDMIVEQICVARGYTASLVDSVEHDQWFWQPSEGVTIE